MKNQTLAAAIGAALLASQGVSAADTEERLDSIESRLQYTEQRLKVQDDTILEVQQGSGVAIAGVVEVEATSSDGDNDITVSTVELGIGAEVTDGVSAEVVLLYEGDTLDVDTALINIAPEGSSISYTLGQFVVPFGVFETNMVSDPLTLDFAETGHNAVIQADVEVGVTTISVYGFNGFKDVAPVDDEDDEFQIDTFGVNFGLELEDTGLGINLGYINDITQSGGLEGYAGEEIAGTALSLIYETGAFTLMGEYVAASGDLSSGETPSAMNIEAAMATMLAGKPSTIAASYQTTTDADSIGLAETRVGAALTLAMMENTSLGFELIQEEAYAGNSASTATVKLGVEF